MVKLKCVYRNRKSIVIRWIAILVFLLGNLPDCWSILLNKGERRGVRKG